MDLTTFNRRAELPFEHQGRTIHAVRFSGRTLDHGDDAPVTCPACVAALSSEES
ncbi:hypothetical protein ACIRPH_31310 [Nocardiopsis sp. NPDC101807]|uniref:hypothetical protein n=1 Tax=Nocardiopsis sp. NPDC101807 TaxID=3364339 RepID=UPI00380FFA69